MKQDTQHMGNLGKTATDKVTGFTGVITSVVYYISGCTQYCVLPKMKDDGKFPDGMYIDYQRLDVTDNALVFESSDNGCCEAPSRS